MATNYVVRQGERESVVALLEDDGDRAVLEVDGVRIALTTTALAGQAVGVDGGAGHQIYRHFSDRRGRHLCAGGVEHVFDVASERELWLRGSGDDDPHRGGRVVASMPGRVVSVMVQIGDAVAEGAIVAVLEAMKMENDIKAAAAGSVTEIAVAAGDAVETGALLVRLEPLT